MVGLVGIGLGVVVGALSAVLGYGMATALDASVAGSMATAAGMLFGLAFFIMGKATPFSLRKEIEEDQNVALAVVIASVIIGIAMIIVAAITG